MKTVNTLLLLSLCCVGGAHAQTTRTQAAVPRVDTTRVNTAHIERNVKLENAVSERSRKVTPSLSSETKRKLDAASRAYARSLARAADADDPQLLAEREVRQRFANLTPEQTNLLSFYVMAQTAQQLAAEKDALKEKLDDMSDMSEMDSMRLQMAMDRRSKFITALSNLLKKISSTQDSVVQNLK